MKSASAIVVWVLACLISLTFVPPADEAEAGAAVRANYERPFEPPTRPAFISLPPGAVEPQGWLRDWCLAARAGYTGNMDQVHVEFRRAWAEDHRMTGERLQWPKGGWPYEGGGYWFDGLARLGFILHDDALVQQAKKRLDVVVNHMHPDSILFLWWLNRNRPEDRKSIEADGAWPMWASGLLGRSLVAYYAGSKDPRVLKALETAYGSDGDWARLGWGMSNPWPAFETWTWTGNKQIAAALDALFAKDGGDRNTPQWSWNRYRRPPNPAPGAERNDQVVHFLESTVPWTIGYLWTGKRDFLDATLGWHDLLERVAMQPSGVPVADEYYGPTGAFRGTETCDVAGYLWSQIVLLQVTGQGRMADRAERAFFNAGPATVARDYRTHVYFQCPNRVVDGSPPHPHGPGAGGNSYQPIHFPLCCTAALNRITPNYVMHLWLATYDNGLAAVHYGPCKVSALVADRVPVELVCRTDYPFNETIDIAVKPVQEATFPLSFRIPGWCKKPELSVNGASVSVAADGNGFVRIERLWKPGDAVRLRFPMPVTVMTGRDANAQGAPYAAFSYGPLLFALPIPEAKGPNTPDPAARWSYALDVEAAQRGDEVAIERQPMPARWDWPLEAPLKLRAKAIPIDWNPDPKAPRLPAQPVVKRQPAERITLVPYGCTKFRISMFPVTAEPAGGASNIRRILFLGNSITLHGPKADIGWTGNWGMAASSPEKDYVHLVAGRLTRNNGPAPTIMVKNIADFERNYATYDVDNQLTECFAFDADLVVLAIGENVPALASAEAKERFKAGVARILKGLRAKRRPLVVVRSSFWPDAAKDQVLREACQEAGGLFVDAGPLGRDPSNAARSERSFSHAGVAAHPGDKGMKALADAILQAVQPRREHYQLSSARDPTGKPE